MLFCSLLLLGTVLAVHCSNHTDRKLQDLNSFGDAKVEIQRLMDLIYNRYELYSPVGDFWYYLQNIGSHGFDIYKYKLALKMVTKGSTFQMTFAGSSVTAGHDNRYNSSFPLIFEKRMSGIFDRIGVKLRVENIAQGTNQCIPYGFCYETMGTPDPDWIGWEQSYNCGHDSSSFELTARVAGMSKNKAILYFSSSGGFDYYKSCPLSPFKPAYCDEDWTVNSVLDNGVSSGVSHWYPSTIDIATHKSRLFDTNRKAPTGSARYLYGYGAGYKDTFGFSAIDFWSPHSIPDPNNPGKTISETPASMVGNKCANRFFSEEAQWFDNPLHRGVPFHPSKAFHILRAEIIAWQFCLAIFDAITMIESDIKHGVSAAQMAVNYKNQLAVLQPDMPPPVVCNKDPRNHNYHCLNRPTCLTDYLPHNNPQNYLRDVVLPKSSWVELNKEYSEFHEYGVRFKDLKPYFTNKDLTGNIYVKIEVTANSDRVWLCGNKPEALRHTSIYLDLDGWKDPQRDLSSYEVNANSLSPTMVLWERPKRQYVVEECTELVGVPAGRHIVIIMRDESIVKGHASSLHTVITWP